MLLHRDIGLKCLKEVGLSLFGMSAMKVELKATNIWPMDQAYSTTLRKSSPRNLKQAVKNSTGSMSRLGLLYILKSEELLDVLP
jgi:hypothetical protein